MRAFLKGHGKNLFVGNHSYKGYASGKTITSDFEGFMEFYKKAPIGQQFVSSSDIYCEGIITTSFDIRIVAKDENGNEAAIYVINPRIQNGTPVYPINKRIVNTFTKEFEPVSYEVRMSLGNSDTNSNYIKNIQIEYGTTATAYEPYKNYQEIRVIDKVKNPNNLLPLPYYMGEKTEDGLTFTPLEDGGIKIVGTSTRTSGYTRFFVYNVADSKLNCDAETVTFSLHNKGGYTPAIYMNIGGGNGDYPLTTVNAGVSKTISRLHKEGVTQHNLNYMLLDVNKGVTVDTVVYPVLVEGSTAQPYYASQLFDISVREPFKNPVNLFDINTEVPYLPYSASTTYTVDGEAITFTSTQTNNKFYYKLDTSLEVGKTYTFSFDELECPNSIGVWLGNTDHPDYVEYGTRMGEPKGSCIFTATSPDLYIKGYINYALGGNGTATFKISKIMINEGETAAPYYV